VKVFIQHIRQMKIYVVSAYLHRIENETLQSHTSSIIIYIKEVRFVGQCLETFLYDYPSSLAGTAGVL